MNQIEHVKLKSDSNYIHIKYAVMEVTVGSSLSNSYAWIKCISFGCDTEENLIAFKLTSDGYQPVPDAKGFPVKQTEWLPVDKSGMVGTMGEWLIAPLSDLEQYNRGGKIDFTSNIQLG